MINIDSNKECVKQLLRMVYNEIDYFDLTMGLDDAGYFVAPASRGHHLNVRGGLCEHSLNVLRLMDNKNLEYGLGIEREEIIMAALFHDLAKCNSMPKRESLSHCVQSVVAAYRIVRPLGESALSLDVVEAIAWHEGLWSGGTSDQVDKAFGTNKLAVLLHICDMEASQLQEKTYPTEVRQ
jgi:hypothetical protein